MVTVPRLLAVKLPELLMLAMPVFEETHVTRCVTSLPLDLFPMNANRAVICCGVPTVVKELPGLMVSRTGPTWAKAWDMTTPAKSPASNNRVSKRIFTLEWEAAPSLYLTSPV